MDIRSAVSTMEEGPDAKSGDIGHLIGPRGHRHCGWCHLNHSASAMCGGAEALTCEDSVIVSVIISVTYLFFLSPGI